jgi:hypothetical protein
MALCVHPSTARLADIPDYLNRFDPQQKPC